MLKLLVSTLSALSIPVVPLLHDAHGVGVICIMTHKSIVFFFCSLFMRKLFIKEIVLNPTCLRSTIRMTTLGLIQHMYRIAHYITSMEEIRNQSSITCITTNESV